MKHCIAKSTHSNTLQSKLSIHRSVNIIHNVCNLWWKWWCFCIHFVLMKTQQSAGLSHTSARPNLLLSCAVQSGMSTCSWIWLISAALYGSLTTSELPCFCISVCVFTAASQDVDNSCSGLGWDLSSATRMIRHSTSPLWAGQATTYWLQSHVVQM